MRKSILRAVSLFVIYFIAAKIGLTFDAVSGFASLVWPPSGIALAALLLFGYQLWPAIFLAAFFVNWSSGAGPLVSIGIGIGNTLEAVVATFLLLRYMKFHPQLDRLRDVLGFIVIGAVVSTLVSATIGTTSLLLGRTIIYENYWQTWEAWWVGDMLGALIVTPFILSWLTPPAFIPTGRKIVEIVILGIIIFLFNMLIFGGLTSPSQNSPISYLIFPPLIFAALRFGSRGGTTAIIATATIAILGTASGFGPFARTSVYESLLYLQVFMALVSVTSLIMAAVVTEKSRSETEALEDEAAVRDLNLALEERALELKEKVGELESTKRAMLNILEDLEAEKNKLKEFDRLKSELISLVAHALRTPLGSMRWNIELLNNTHSDTPNRIKTKLKSIYESNLRMIELVNDVLNVARIEEGRVLDSPEQVDVRKLILEVIKELNVLAQQKNVTIIFEDKAANTHILTIDRKRLYEVIRSLLDNAIKYNKTGGNIKIKVTYNKDEYIFIVEDTGLGVPKEEQDKLFTKFFRTASALSKGIDGTGLGLFIVKSYVEGWGGTISFDSPTQKDGSGTVFYIKLPVPVKTIITKKLSVSSQSNKFVRL